MSAKENIDLVDTNIPTNKNGDWFQIHNDHKHDDLSPHTHYPEVKDVIGKQQRKILIMLTNYLKIVV